jgi:hypothetical protein
LSNPKKRGFNRIANGKTSNPEIKNLIPANCTGVVYSSPIFTPANAEDQRRQEMMASMVVLKVITKGKYRFSSYPASPCEIWKVLGFFRLYFGYEENRP